MTPRGGAAAAAALGLLLAGCGGGGDTDFGGSCSGSQTGEAVLQGVNGRLEDGNSVRISSINTGDDPPWVRFSLADASPQETSGAEHVAVGDTFELNGASYELVGICPDKAYLQTR